MKIIFAALLMGVFIVIVTHVMNTMLGNYLNYHFLIKVTILGFLGALGIICFIVLAIIMHILSLRELLKTFLKKGKA